MRLSRPLRVTGCVALAISVGFVAPACGKSATPAAQAESISKISDGVVPSEIEGLAVASEDTAIVNHQKRPFVDAVGLYSLRKGDLLQATLQISRFTKESNADTRKFRDSVVAQIGATTPRTFVMSGRTVYLTTGRRQSVAVWWRGHYLFILSTREEYETPRTLLRSALEIKP